MSGIDLGGKIAVVTGGGRGLGRAMTLALARAGAKVAEDRRLERDMAPLETATSSWTVEPGSPGRAGADGQLIDPVVMGVPVVWLASDYADGVNARRFTGKDWSLDLPPDRGAENVMGPAGFAPLRDG